MGLNDEFIESTSRVASEEVRMENRKSQIGLWYYDVSVRVKRGGKTLRAAGYVVEGEKLQVLSPLQVIPLSFIVNRYYTFSRPNL